MDEDEQERPITPAPFNAVDVVIAVVATVRNLALAIGGALDDLHSSLLMHTVWLTQKKVRADEEKRWAARLGLEIEKLPATSKEHGD